MFWLFFTLHSTNTLCILVYDNKIQMFWWVELSSLIAYNQFFSFRSLENYALFHFKRKKGINTFFLFLILFFPLILGVHLNKDHCDFNTSSPEKLSHQEEKSRPTWSHLFSPFLEFFKGNYVFLLLL